MDSMEFVLEDLEELTFGLDTPVKKMYPELENLEVTPSTEEQIFTHDGSYGYDKVTVKSMGKIKYKPQTISFRNSSSTDLTYETKNLDISLLTNTVSMFSGSTKLETIDLSEWDVSNITNFNSMFYNNYALKNIIGVENIIVTNKANNIAAMFFGCNSLEYIDTSKWDTSNITLSTSSTFYNCKSLKRLDVSNWDTSKIPAFAEVSYGMFENCESLEELDVSNWDVSNSTYFSAMFAGCRKLKTIDMSKWVCNNPAPVREMFKTCLSLEYADVSWVIMEGNTDSPRDMFHSCRALKSVKMFPYTSTKSYGSTTISMFEYCQSLEEIDLSSWTTNDITEATYMFRGCSKLKRIILSNLITDRLTKAGYMFDECSSLEYLDIRNFTFDKITTYTNMFRNIPANCEIIVKDNTAKAWVLARRSDFINVKTVAEYEAA